MDPNFDWKAQALKLEQLYSDARARIREAEAKAEEARLERDSFQQVFLNGITIAFDQQRKVFVYSKLGNLEPLPMFKDALSDRWFNHPGEALRVAAATIRELSRLGG